MKERENEERRDVCVSDEIELKFHEMDYKEINIEMNTSEGDNGEKKVASIKIDKIKSGMTENNEVRVDILTSTGNKDEVDSDASTSETGLIQPISGSINMLAAPQSNNDESISENIGKGCEESVASDISTSFKDDEGEICPSSDDDYSNESFEIEDDEIVIPDNSAEDKMIDTSQSNESKSTRKDKEITLNIKKDKIEKHYLPANKMTIFSKNDDGDNCPVSNNDNLNESFEIKKDKMVIPENSVKYKVIENYQSRKGYTNHNIKQNDDMLSSYEDSNFKLLSNPSSLCKKLAPLLTSKNRLEKLSPSNHKRDSSVFDLPPLPVTGSSSTLIKNKNSAIQECQPLNKVSDHDKSIKDEFNDASKGGDIDIFMSTSNHVEADANSSMKKQDEGDSDASTSETGFIQPIAGSLNMFAAPQSKNDKFDESINEEIGEECEESVASDISTSFKEDENDICPLSDDDDLNKSFEIEDDEMVIPDNSVEDKKIDICQSNERKLTVNIKEVKTENQSSHANEISTSSKNDKSDKGHLSNDDDLDKSVECKKYEMVIPDDSADNKMIFTCQPSQKDDELSSYEDSNFKLLSNPSSLCKKLAPLPTLKNKFGKLPPLNHKRDSSVFDLPPLPVTVSSSSLIKNKNSATQKCQPLDKVSDHDKSIKDEFNDASKGCDIDIFMSTSNHVEADANSSMENQDEVHSDASTSETGFIQPIAGSPNMFAAPQPKNDKFDESISEEIGEECEESVASDISTSFKEDEIDICPSSNDDDLNESFEIEDDEMVIPDNSAEDKKMIVTCQPSNGKTIRNIEERDDELSSYEDSNFKLLSNPSSLCKKLAPLSISKNRLGKLPPLNHKQDSSVFDLPPLPVTGSSSSLINKKNSATQECQLLAENTDNDNSTKDEFNDASKGGNIDIFMSTSNDVEADANSSMEKQDEVDSDASTSETGFMQPIAGSLNMFAAPQSKNDKFDESISEEIGEECEESVASDISSSSKENEVDICPLSDDDDLNKSFEIEDGEMVIPDNGADNKMILTCQPSKGKTIRNIEERDDELSSYEDSNFKLLSNPSSLCKKLAPLSISKNRLGKLPPLNHKQDSSVFDLPPLPVTDSSSMLINNKDSATQECQPLDHDDSNNDDDDVNFDDIDALLLDLDEFDSKRANKEPRAY
ncbi:titin homolog [Hydractinia symbiolongicarpus]|uniref:titin homolog n=1 Tax=Hydractinia symbiolongicarpus TaxID=13093 RepID=UPI00254F0496|nr:titin homolog [Hydractinia symbiolongicarpus]